MKGPRLHSHEKYHTCHKCVFWESEEGVKACVGDNRGQVRNRGCNWVRHSKGIRKLRRDSKENGSRKYHAEPTKYEEACTRAEVQARAQCHG